MHWNAAIAAKGEHDMDIKLNFINRSDDQNNSDVLIFGKNLVAQRNALAVAWMIIQNCGRGDNHPFVFPPEIELGAIDSFGNHTPPFPAQPGQRFEMVRDRSGDVLQLSKQPATAEYEVQNSLPGTTYITAMACKAGKPYASVPYVGPNMIATFAFQPVIYICAVSSASEGGIRDTATLTDSCTELPLQGIASADIVMTGGGPGPKATPFRFTLQNVVTA